MKDSVIALVEALRLARLELHCYRDPRCAATPDWTIERLEALLMDPVVGKSDAACRAGGRKSVDRAAADRRALLLAQLR